MIDPADLDRIRCVVESLPGVRGFALALSYDTKIEVLLHGAVAPEASSKAIVDVAQEVRAAQGEERPLRLN